MYGNELERYATPHMSQIWSGDWKFRQWAQVEIEAAKALGAPQEAINDMDRAPVPTASAVEQEEARTRHDVIAFLNLWRKDMGPQGISWTHRGLTSSDVVDTVNGLRFKASTDVIRASLEKLTHFIGNQALMYKDAVRVGRTHGQSAEVTTWGWRLAAFTHDLMRAERRLSALSELYEVGKLSGPVGDYKSMAPADELGALRNLGLRTTFASTQIVGRDTYVDYVFALSQIASVIESIALEVRLSSRSEVGEMREGTLGSQRGSSAMPHKRNPITAEKLCGLARVVRAQVDMVAQGVASHHERDISHSSVERLALATASQVTDYMLVTCLRLMSDLRVYPERMRANVLDNLDLLSSLIKTRMVDDDHDPTFAYEVVFWGFHEWSQPGNGGFETLADALLDSYGRCADQLNVLVEPPDFNELVGLLDEPEKLVGQTRFVYEELDAHINGHDLPF